MTDAYFRAGEGLYYPTEACTGPWDPNSLSGRVVVALLAFEIERLVAGADYLPARLTVDMYRLPDFSPIEVKTRLVRDGYRIKVVDAEFVSNGISVARASCQMLRKTENSPIVAWRPEPWHVPAPEDVPEGEFARRLDDFTRQKSIEGNMAQFGRKKMWISNRRDIVAGVPLSQWMRAALVADLTNPWANSGDGGLGYINSDVTLYLHRLPCDEWVGMDVVNHQATDGVAIGECWLYDREGSIGTSMVTSLAQKRGPTD